MRAWWDRKPVMLAHPGDFRLQDSSPWCLPSEYNYSVLYSWEGLIPKVSHTIPWSKRSKVLRVETCHGKGPRKCVRLDFSEWLQIYSQEPGWATSGNQHWQELRNHWERVEKSTNYIKPGKQRGWFQKPDGQFTDTTERANTTLQDSRKSLRNKTRRLLFESQAISRMWALCQHRALGICSCQSQTSKQTQHPLDTEKGRIQIHRRAVNLGAEILKKRGSRPTMTFLNKKKQYLLKKNSIYLSNIKVN